MLCCCCNYPEAIKLSCRKRQQWFACQLKLVILRLRMGFWLSHFESLMFFSLSRFKLHMNLESLIRKEIQSAAVLKNFPLIAAWFGVCRSWFCYGCDLVLRASMLGSQTTSASEFRKDDSVAFCRQMLLVSRGRLMK